MVLHSCNPCQEQRRSVPGICCKCNHSTQDRLVCCLRASVEQQHRSGFHSSHVCASDIADGYCFVVLLGNRRVTVWCNCGYEHVRHSLWPHRKEKRGHRSRTRGRGRGEGLKAMIPVSPFGPQPVFLSTLSQLPHAITRAGAETLSRSQQ